MQISLSLKATLKGDDEEEDEREISDFFQLN